MVELASERSIFVGMHQLAVVVVRTRNLAGKKKDASG